MTEHTAVDNVTQCDWLARSLGLRSEADLFPWQRELLRSFPVDGVRRYFVDIPTGLGKTSVIAIWLVARALGKPVPRRLVYVVDRRTVVDQASTEAERLRDWIESQPDVKQALGLTARSLPVSTLRGKHIDNREWLEDPSLPAIIIGTVDMIGSRLLFEGYRTTRKMRPYHAGLMGVDVFLVLDEAHLVPPFERLLETIAAGDSRFGPAEPGLKVPPFILMSLSATGSHVMPCSDARTFTLTPADYVHEKVRKRLEAPKVARLIPADDAKQFAASLAERAWNLATRNAAGRRCVVFCNRRDDAQQVHGALGKRTERVQLLVGARRLYERDRAAADLEKLGFMADSDTTDAGPAFLVATSAGEVGIDLDADDMVSDLVPWERMVQRFGRVNRRGNGSATIEVLRTPGAVPSSSAEDDSQGVSTEGEQDDRYVVPYRHLPHVDGGVNVSPGALRNLKERGDLRDDLAQASTPVPLHPQLTRAHVDAWAMTSLPEHTGRPKIEPWLRGWNSADPPQCAVAWRAFLPVPERGDPQPGAVEAFFEAAPIHPLEILETEAFRVAEWLIARAASLKQSGIAGSKLIALVLSRGGRLGDRWSVDRLLEKEIRRRKTRDVLGEAISGATLVVDACVGGLEEGLLKRECPDAPPTLDAEDGLSPEICYRVRVQGPADDAQASTSTAGWKETYRFVLDQSDDGDPIRWLVVEERKTSASSEDARSVTTRPQLLDEHQSWAEGRARDLAIAVAPELAPVLGLAARLHDEGKKARLWQRAFNAPTREIYAKTSGPINASLLGGYRHEFGSLGYAMKHAEFQSLSSEERDLLLHLIAAHHGFARPLISAEGCDDAPPSALETRRREVAQRFSRLQMKWGPWGLAWLEALLRAADQQASRKNDEEEAPR